MAEQPPNQVRKNAAVAALALSVVGGFEGLRQTAYPDPATRGAPWTICYGHTGHVTPGERDSLAQCKALLLADLDREADGIERCIHVPMPDARYVAVLSLAHNIGVAGVCRSSIARDLNAGEVQAACDAFLRYDRAAGIVMPGLTRRREQERALCMEPT
jgi:lysozyme